MNGWTLAYDRYEPENEGLREALCALGNGVFVTRAAGAETHADDIHYPGTYLAGGYNRLSTEVSGRMVENEDLVNLPNWLPLQVRIEDDEALSPDRVEIMEFRQELDIHGGLLTRTMRVRDRAGRITRWSERRIVSMADPHAAAVVVTVEPQDWSGKVTVLSTLDGSVINHGVARYRQLNSQHLEPIATGRDAEDTIYLQSRFNQARTEVAEAARTRLFRNGVPVDAERKTIEQPEIVAQEVTVNLRTGDKLEVEKVVALYTSRCAATSEPGIAAREKVRKLGSFGDLLAAHRTAWRHLWEECHIAIHDHDTVVKLRIHIFHLLQTVSYNTIERDVGVPARGWHGEAYRGHVFWDELFILPFLSLRLPAIARALLLYRYRRLPEARELAAAEGFKGAMFPWQSGSSGREESQLLHLNPKSGRWVPDATFRQRHVSAAVAFNVWHYHESTNDIDFLASHGAELLLEIARFWGSLATWNPTLGRYEIKGVMGPDEFHTAYPGVDEETEGGLNNNTYTNVMASWILMKAMDALEMLPEDRKRQLMEKLELTQGEIETWDEIRHNLVIPFHGDGMISQFEGYEELKDFDWDAARRDHGDIQRLDRILEAGGESVNDYKVSKQADLLMLLFLFSADELVQMFERLGYAFDTSQIPKIIDYYYHRTSHGSTLSYVVHAWVLARGNRGRSWQMFQHALDADLTDIQGGTTKEGIHLGAMAGTVDIVQRCYTGLEVRGHVLRFDPALPADLKELEMRVRYRGQVLDVLVDHDHLRVASRRFTTDPIMISYRGHTRVLGPGHAYTFKLLKERQRGGEELELRAASD